MHSEPINLHIGLKKSAYMAWWLGLIHILSILAVMALPIQPEIRLMGLFLLLVSAYWQFRRHYLHDLAKSIVSLQASSADGWSLQLRNGDKLLVELLPSSFVKPWLTVLRFDCGQRCLSRSIVLFVDSLDAESARLLRIYLYHQLLPQKGS